VWQALAADAPSEAARARPVLDQVLHATHASTWPEVAWCCSRLTPDGTPLEFVWRPGVRGVFWTAEVAGPETREALRFALATELLAAWGPAPFRGLTAAIARLQRGRTLRFGAWVGGRHMGALDSYKAYAEIPAGTDWLSVLGDWIRDPRALARCRECLLLRCVGIEPGTGRVELYLRSTDTAHESFWALLSALSLEQQGATLLATLAQLAGRPGVGIAPVQPWGLGLRYGSDQSLDAVSLFAMAPSLCRDEARLRSAWRVLAQSDGSCLARQWVERAALRAVMVGVTTGPGADCATAQLGLAPRLRTVTATSRTARAVS
jgi:hypothetical protein